MLCPVTMLRAIQKLRIDFQQNHLKLNWPELLLQMRRGQPQTSNLLMRSSLRSCLTLDASTKPIHACTQSARSHSLRVQTILKSSLNKAGQHTSGFAVKVACSKWRACSSKPCTLSRKAPTVTLPSNSLCAASKSKLARLWLTAAEKQGPWRDFQGCCLAILLWIRGVGCKDRWLSLQSRFGSEIAKLRRGAVRLWLEAS